MATRGDRSTKGIHCFFIVLRKHPGGMSSGEEGQSCSCHHQTITTPSSCRAVLTGKAGGPVAAAVSIQKGLRFWVGFCSV